MLRLVFAITALACSTSLLADNTLHYDMIQLSASAKTEVSQDELNAVLQVMVTGSDPEAAAEEVNQRMMKLLDELEGEESIDYSTTAYNSRPRYDDGKIARWQVSQQLRLSSQHFDTLTSFITWAQAHATVQNMQFSLSDEMAEKYKSQLTRDAIDQFRQKAELVQQQFGKTGYRLVNLNINDNGFSPRPVMDNMLMRAESQSKQANVSVEPGEDNVTVTVNGQVQLIGNPDQLD